MKDNFDCSYYHSSGPGGGTHCPYCAPQPTKPHAPDPFKMRFHAGLYFALSAFVVTSFMTLVFFLRAGVSLLLLEVFIFAPTALAGAFGELLGQMIIADDTMTSKQAGFFGFVVSFCSLLMFCLILAIIEPSPWGKGNGGGTFLLYFFGACILVGWLIFPIGIFVGVRLWANAGKIRQKCN